jgi:hypothetical protein
MDKDGLKALYGSDQCASALLDYCRARTNKSSESKVGTIEEALGSAFPRSQIIKVLKNLEDLNVGKFIEGRRGKESRFSWVGSMIEVGALASVAGDSSEAQSVTTASEKHSSGAPVSALLGHSFRLRPDVTIALALPPNLTLNEAARLADFIKTLPFEPANGGT